MNDSHLTKYEVDELETMFETIEGEIKTARKERQPGQTPEFWNLVAESQSVRRALASKSVTVPRTVRNNLMQR